jgi:hypothetical protein
MTKDKQSFSLISAERAAFFENGPNLARFLPSLSNSLSLIFLPLINYPIRLKKFVQIQSLTKTPYIRFFSGHTAG